MYKRTYIKNAQNFQSLPLKNISNLSNKKLFSKSPVWLCRRAYVLSFGFKIKPLRKNVFLC